MAQSKPLFCTLLVLILTFLSVSSGHAQEAETQDKELQSGIWNYRHENFEEALEILKKVRAEKPKSSLAAYYLGITYKQMQDYGEALPHLEAAVLLTPRIKGALIELIDLLIRLDRVDEALSWIGVAEDEGIRPAQVAFLKGLALLKKGDDLDAAILSLEKAKELDASLTQVADYHIGVAHLKSEELEDAKEVFKELVTQDPNTDLATFANQYIDAIDRRQEEMRPLKLHAGFQFQYDDNVILKPDDAALASNITDKGDTRQVYTFRGEYDFRPSKTFGTKLGYSFYYGKQSDLGFYDTVNNNFAVQPAFYLDDVAISFPASYYHAMVNDKSYLSSASVGNLNNIKFGTSQMGQASFSYRYKDYLWEPTTDDEDRDAHEFTGWLAWYKFFAKNKGFVSFKYAANYDNAEGRNWGYIGHKGTVSALVPIIERLKFSVAGEFFLQNFTNTHTVYDKKRRDAGWTVSSLLALEVLKDLEVSFRYTFVDNGSNINLYDYQRNVYSVGVSYEF